MRSSLGDDEELVVDMAPLIDCVFLLLIFFLVATTLKKIDKELPLTLPESQASMEVQQPDEFKVISIDMEGRYYIDGTPVTLGLMQEEFGAIAAENPDMKVRLDIHRHVEFSRVMQIMDMIRFEGLTNVGINTHSDENYE